jgi:hypothetical protein
VGNGGRGGGGGNCGRGAWGTVARGTGCQDWGSIPAATFPSDMERIVEICGILRLIFLVIISDRPVAEFFIIGERFVVINGQLQAAEVLSKLSTMKDKSSFV